MSTRWNPFAAHPTSVYGAYDYDAEQIERYVAAARTPTLFALTSTSTCTGDGSLGDLAKVGGSAGCMSCGQIRFWGIEERSSNEPGLFTV